jgi:hypothetical protein
MDLSAADVRRYQVARGAAKNLAFNLWATHGQNCPIG